MIPRIPPVLIEYIRNAGSGVWYIIAVIALLSVSPGVSYGQEMYHSGNIEIVPSGALWLEGSASIVDYRCYAERLDGTGVIANSTHPELNIQGEGDVALQVTLPIRSLECGKEKMNRDMYEALQANRHPNITYRLLDAEMLNEISNPDSVGWMNIGARGLLTVAGVTDTTEMILQGQPIGQSRFRIKGSFPLNMRDFNIKPPTALLGLIRASEELIVHFDVSVFLND